MGSYKKRQSRKADDKQSRQKLNFRKNMATNNRISAVLSDADKTAILAAITTIKTKLPFLVTLEIKERKSLRKLASKRQGYAKSTADGVKAFPNAMPNTFPTAEYLKDANLMAALSDIAPLLMGLAANLDDTLMQLGSELLTSTDFAYGYLKSAAKQDSNVKPIVEKIAAALKQKSLVNIDKTQGNK